MPLTTYIVSVLDLSLEYPIYQQQQTAPSARGLAQELKRGKVIQDKK
jgi:hypothetical protein